MFVHPVLRLKKLWHICLSRGLVFLMLRPGPHVWNKLQFLQRWLKWTGKPQHYENSAADVQLLFQWFNECLFNVKTWLSVLSLAGLQQCEKMCEQCDWRLVQVFTHCWVLQTDTWNRICEFLQCWKQRRKILICCFGAQKHFLLSVLKAWKILLITWILTLEREYMNFSKFWGTWQITRTWQKEKIKGYVYTIHTERDREYTV